MKIKVKATIIIASVLLSVSAYACTELKTLSERLACQKSEEAVSKSKVLKTYSELLDYLSDVKEYQSQIKRSQEQWEKSAALNCDVYAYFVEEGSITHEITVSECMTREYKQRESYLMDTRAVVEEFF